MCVPPSGPWRRRISEGNAAGAVTTRENAIATYRKVLWINAISVGLAVLCGIVLSMFMTQSITGPIQQLVQLASALAKSDLTSRIGVQGKDEAARLLHSVTRLNDSLTRIAGQVRNSSDSSATGNQDLSQRTEEQASNLQQTAASIEQISSTVKNNSETAGLADKVATQACASALKGGQVVATVVATMQDIAASSKKMADVIGVIDGIAFQTNILALNAAVEAAGPVSKGAALPSSREKSSPRCNTSLS